MLLMPLYYIIFFVTLLIPGYVLVRRIGVFKQNPGAELALGYGITIIFFALLATLSYAAKVGPILTQVLTIFTILLSVYELIKKRYYVDIWILRFPLICVLIMSMLATLLISLPFLRPYSVIPDPKPNTGSNYRVYTVKLLNIAQTQANDNSIPYRQAQFFNNRLDPATAPFIEEWGVNFFVRTPLMGAVTANYFNLLGEKPPVDLIWRKSTVDKHNTYIQFQILANILNSLFILPAFFLLSKFFNKKTATLTCLFITINQYFLYNAFFSWPKSLVAFFVLTSWLLILEKKKTYTLAAGIMLAIAYLTHDLAVLYIGATLLYLLFSRRLKDLLWIILAPLACVLGWILIAGRIYHQPSNFMYYPFSLYDIPQPSQHRMIIQEFLHTSPIKIIYIRLQNIFYLLSPYQLFSAKLNGTLPATFWALSLYSIPGALGIGLMPVVFVAAFKKLADWKFWILAIFPVLFEVVIIGWPRGLGALHFAEASVVLLMGVSIHLLTRLNKSYWLLLAYLLNVGGLVLFITFSYHFAIRGWFNTIFHTAITFAIIGLVMVVSWLVSVVQRGKSPKWLKV